MYKLIENPIRGALIAAAILTAGIYGFSQDVPPSRPAPSPKPPVTSPKVSTPRIPRPPALPGETSEKYIKVDPEVNVWLPCVSRGTVRINGWNRNEVRVFVDDGNKFTFKVQEKSPQTGEPVWIKVTGIDPRYSHGPASECIWGDEIEIDVPKGAAVNIRGHEITTRIDSVKKAEIKVIGGNISLRNVSNGISASAGQGDIAVESSKGSIVLDSTTGNILVFEAGPGEIADIFKAKTNSGAISLQGLAHRQVEVYSTSGSVSFAGSIRTSGSYNIRTTRGSIRLIVPAGISSRISATYGYGFFRSDFPIEIVTENISEGPIKTVVGNLGKGGDTLIKLTSSNGSISIVKQ